MLCYTRILVKNQLYNIHNHVGLNKTRWADYDISLQASALEADVFDGAVVWLLLNMP